jgi:hypothetical protein
MIKIRLEISDFTINFLKNVVLYEIYSVISRVRNTYVQWLYINVSILKKGHALFSRKQDIKQNDTSSQWSFEPTMQIDIWSIHWDTSVQWQLKQWFILRSIQATFCRSVWGFSKPHLGVPNDSHEHFLP